MNLHEYQSKKIFASYGIPVPTGAIASTPDEAVAAAKQLGGSIWVVKAQVHAGGRGKAGGVKLARDADAVRAAAQEMLGTHLVTKQTGPEGLPVSQVYVESGSAIEREIYLSLTLNREKSRIAIIASAAGGMDIEHVAATTPEKILSATIHPAVGLEAYQARELAFGLGFTGAQIGEFQTILAALRDTTQEDAMELKASEHDLNYVSLDGDIACMVNGAGLAMATMDLIKLHGGTPANFLDVGGGATAERVTAAFELILSNPKVKAILVNIFGGIVRCDLIAEGVIIAVKKVGVKVPVVVRLEGTNAVAAREMLGKSGLAITAAEGLTDAAKKVIAGAKGNK